MALNVMLLVIAMLLSVMTVVRFTNNYLAQGTANLIFSILSILALYWMRGNKNRSAVVARLTSLSAWIVLSTLFFNIPEDNLRIAWFLVLTPPTFFLCGSKFGIFISALSFFTVVSAHTFGNSGYSDYDILYYSNLSFIITIFLVFYEYKSTKHREQLLLYSRELEDRVMERTLDLQQEQEKLQAITENVPGVVFQFYANNAGETGVYYTSPKLFEIFGLEFIDDPSELLQKFAQNIHVEDQQSWKDSVHEAIEKQMTWKWRGRYIKPSGEIIWFEEHSIPTVRKDEIIFDGILIDITDKIEQQTALRQAKEDAEAASNAKTEFLANMSHEMRTPMHAMLGFANVGRKKFEKAPRQRLGEYFSLIHESGERLLGFLSDLLDLATLDAKAAHYDFQLYDLNLSVAIIIQETQFELQKKDLSISFQEDLPHIALFDRQKIIQVLHNLLNNAVKFSDPETTIAITIDEVDIAGAIFQQVKVKDKGVGLPETELEVIFDRFKQSSITKTGAGGTGLGLAICRGILEAHSGKIWAENNPDGGSSLYFVLPTAPVK